MTARPNTALTCISPKSVVSVYSDREERQSVAHVCTVSVVREPDDLDLGSGNSHPVGGKGSRAN